MAGLTVHMDDLHQLVATLTKKTEGMDSRTAMVVRKAAFDVERFAKVYAPVDTGFLKNSIHTVITTNRLRVYAAEVIAEAEYASFVEHGTSRMSPQPYMQPALDRVTPGFLAVLELLANPLSTT
jgi:HK97 gp10 family phage protein